MSNKKYMKNIQPKVPFSCNTFTYIMTHQNDFRRFLKKMENEENQKKLNQKIITMNNNINHVY